MISFHVNMIHNSPVDLNNIMMTERLSELSSAMVGHYSSGLNNSIGLLALGNKKMPQGNKFSSRPILPEEYLKLIFYLTHWSLGNMDVI